MVFMAFSGSIKSKNVIQNGQIKICQYFLDEKFFDKNLKNLMIYKPRQVSSFLDKNRNYKKYFSRTGGGPSGRQDRQPHHGGVRSLDRHQPGRAQDVPQAGRQIPDPDAQLQHSMVRSGANVIIRHLYALLPASTLD
jgi:hypothetical protein